MPSRRTPRSGRDGPEIPHAYANKSEETFREETFQTSRNHSVRHCDVLRDPNYLHADPHDDVFARPSLRDLSRKKQEQDMRDIPLYMQPTGFHQRGSKHGSSSCRLSKNQEGESCRSSSTISTSALSPQSKKSKRSANSSRTCASNSPSSALSRFMRTDGSPSLRPAAVSDKASSPRRAEPPVPVEEVLRLKDERYKPKWNFPRDEKRVRDSHALHAQVDGGRDSTPRSAYGQISEHLYRTPYDLDSDYEGEEDFFMGPKKADQ